MGSCQKSGGFLFEWQRAVRGLKLSLSTRAVVLTVASYADMDGGSCFPGQERLAKDCCCSPSTIKRAIKEALAAGVISVQERRFGMHKTSNLYRLTLPDGGKRAGGGKREGQGVTCDPTKGSQVTSTLGVTGDPLPTQQEKTTQRDHLSNARVGARGRGKPAKRRSEPTPQQRRFLSLWSRVMFGMEQPKAWGLEGASYPQMTEALAWTIYNKQQLARVGENMHNVPAYFVSLLKTVVNGGKTSVRTWTKTSLWGLLETGLSPDAYKARRSRA